MNRQGSAAFCVIMLILLAACGRSELQLAAPTNQAETGYLIQGQEQLTEPVIQKSQKFRLLNQRHGLYEVYGLSREEILSISPRLKVQRNTYYNHLLDLHQQSEEVSAQALLNSTLSQNAELPIVLQSCQPRQDSPPQAALQIKSSALSQSVTMKLGETLHLSAATSRVTDSKRRIAEIRWDVIAPPLSQRSRNQPEVGSDLIFTPDTVGVYRLVLVVQDSRAACGLLQVRFLVTHDPELEEVGRSPQDWIRHRDELSHLRAIRVPSPSDLDTNGLVVAVLDTGLHYNHPGIQENLWRNPKESSLGSDFDSDGNGFVADQMGWDFINGDNKPFDDEGHGSHVSGLIASPVVGVTPKVQIMPIKVLNGAGGGDVGSIIAGIYYAVDNGAKVINASLQRLSTQIEALQEAVAYAHSQGVVFVTSAGNDGLDLSLPGIDIYPGEIQQPNVINVAAVDSQGELTPYSNYGANQVHVAAPGGDREGSIVSLAPLNPQDLPFVGSSGTSMAAPMVAGLVARMMLANPYIRIDEIHQILRDSGQLVPSLATKVGSGSVIDVERAQQMALDLHHSSHIF